MFQKTVTLSDQEADISTVVIARDVRWEEPFLGNKDSKQLKDYFSGGRRGVKH